MPKKRRFVGSPRWSNCWLAILILAPRLRWVIFSWKSWKKPPHPLGILRSGNLIHFKYLQGGINGLWFVGRYEILHKSFIRKK